MNSNDLLFYSEKLKEEYYNSTTIKEKAYYRIYINNLLNLYNDISNSKLKFKANKLIKIEQVNIREQSFNTFKEKVKQSQYKDMISKICSNSIEILKKQSFPVQNIGYDLNKDKMNEIILAFFYDFDKTIYEFVKTCLEEKIFILDLSNKKGFFSNKNITPYCSYIEPLDLTYIALDKNSKTILSDAVHEIGHIINLHYLTNNKSFNYFNFLFDTFSEVPSTFFEFFFINWCIENNIYKDEMYKTYINKLYSLSVSLYDLQLINVYIDQAVRNSIYIKHYDYKLASNYNVSIHQNLFYYIDEKYQYPLGTLIALYYLNLYKSGKSFISIDEFIKNVCFMDDFELLNNFAVNFDEFINCDYLQKSLIKSKK